MNDNWVVIEHNVIDYNSCISTDYEASRAGIILWGNARISGNNIATKGMEIFAPYTKVL